MISNKGPFLEKLGANIRRFRKERNMSLDTLAALCDYEKANLSRIESGKTNATVYTLYNISKVMGIEMCKFFEGYNDARNAEDAANAA
ncbi:MAG: helix-turn-helix transcriptional regulator [Bacteroidetes bacterium]|nr:helix-turn-helix transcriptional regulator [Bacteroidota bacterium]MBS1619601.1 helix-turn-helix transcriptional regulator [Bacteroidota bacterium]